MSWIPIGHYPPRNFRRRRGGRLEFRIEISATDSLRSEADEDTVELSFLQHSVRYDPGRVSSDRVINVSARAIELNIGGGGTRGNDRGSFMGVSWNLNFRAFEASLEELASGRINLLAVRIIFTAENETPNFWRLMGCRWNRRAAVSGRLRAVAKFVLSSTDSQKFLRISRRTRDLLRLTRRNLANNDEIRRLREARSSISGQIRSLRNHNPPGETLTRQIRNLQQRSIQIAEELQEKVELKRTLRHRLRTTASRISRLKASIRSRIGRSTAGRFIRRSLLPLGQRLLRSLIPVLNGIALLSDIWDAIKFLEGVFYGTLEFGLEEGVDEEQENSAESIEESNVDAPDTATEANSVNAASRGIHETGSVNQINDEQRGLDEPQVNDEQRGLDEPQVNEQEAVRPIQPRSQEENLENEVSENDSENAAPNPNPPPLSVAIQRIINIYIDFLIANRNRDVPYFDSFENFGELRVNQRLNGRMIVLHGRRQERVAGSVEITITAKNETSVQYSHPRFIAYNKQGRSFIVPRRRRQTYDRAYPATRSEIDAPDTATEANPVNAASKGVLEQSP